jgi:quercetin dioxygenase-like cupin family protein
MISRNEDLPVVVYGPGILERHPAHDPKYMDVLEAIYEPGVQLSHHAHNDEAQISYIIKGKIRLEQGGETVVLEAGSYFYTPPGVAHQIVEVIEPTVKVTVGVPINGSFNK